MNFKRNANPYEAMNIGKRFVRLDNETETIYVDTNNREKITVTELYNRVQKMMNEDLHHSVVMTAVTTNMIKLQPGWDVTEGIEYVIKGTIVLDDGSKYESKMFPKDGDLLWAPMRKKYKVEVGELDEGEAEQRLRELRNAYKQKLEKYI